MSEQQAEQSGHETGSVGTIVAVPNSSDAPIDRMMASGQAAHTIESPDLVPDQDKAADTRAFELKAETTNSGMPKAEPFTVQGSKVEHIKADAPKPDKPTGNGPQAERPKPDAHANDSSGPGTPETDAVRADATRLPRELLIVSPGERGRTRGEDRVEGGHPAPEPDIGGPTRGRRFAAMAAMLLLAVIAGAAGGALATVSLSHLTETSAAAPNVAALETSVGRIDADIAALKAGLERTANTGLTQSGKAGDRLERIEKAQAEAATKLAKLGEAIDKLRAAASAAATPVAAAAPKDVTGSVTTSAGAQALPVPQLHAAPATIAAANAPASEVGRLPTIEGWVLRDVSRGVALIEGRGGLYEVFAGDPVPGLGRVDAIRKQDGRWVVVTSKGLIVAR